MFWPCLTFQEQATQAALAQAVREANRHLESCDALGDGNLVGSPFERGNGMHGLSVPRSQSVCRRDGRRRGGTRFLAGRATETLECDRYLSRAKLCLCHFGG